MAMRSTPMSERIGSQIHLDKAAMLSGEHAAAIRELLEQRGVVFFRDVHFDDAEQTAFARTLGTVRLGEIRSEGEGGIMKVTRDEKENPDYAAYFHGTFHWHMDGTYEDVPPLASILSAKILAAVGGQTEFANTYAAFADLSAEEQARFERTRMLHTMEQQLRLAWPEPTEAQLESWRTFPPRVHPLVWNHRSGRKSLVLGSSLTAVEGDGADEGAGLIERLMGWATQPRYVYRHEWQVGDVLIWDNTGTMHRAEPYAADSGRRLHRITLMGEEPLAVAA